MSELSGQLLSVKLQNLAGESAGHNNESALNEIVFDNPTDNDVTDIKLLTVKSNFAWAILDNGPGIQNINNLWGSGKGIKVKSGDKIGNKIAGELAGACFFQPKKVLYFSRCNNNPLGRKHQQLNAQIDKMILTVKTPGLDLTDAEKIITEGPARLIRIPEPDNDEFDNGNVAYIKELFKNNEHIVKYFDDDNCTGMLKVFTYYEPFKTEDKTADELKELIKKENQLKERYSKLIADLPQIYTKTEFLTYNTVKFFRGDSQFEGIDIDDNSKLVINKETCSANFILGKNALIEEDDISSHSWIRNDQFGIISEKVLYFNNDIYEYQGKKYNHCMIENYDEEFLIGPDLKRYLNKDNTHLKDMICTQENFVASIVMLLSFVDKNEADEQATIIDDKLEELKRSYVFYNGRHLSASKIPIIGIQERSLPHFRIIISLDEDSSVLVPIRAQKSSIDLSKSDPIILKTFNDIIKPILNKYGSSKGGASIIQNGINNWEDYETDVLRELGVPIAQTTATSQTTSPQTTSPQTTSPPQTTSQTTSSTTVAIPPIPPPSERSGTMVLAALTPKQSIKQLERIISDISKKPENYRTKKQRSHVYSCINNVEKALVLDEDLLVDKITNVIQLIKDSGKKEHEKIPNAAALQEL